jgi:hypothetical protein
MFDFKFDAVSKIAWTCTKMYKAGKGQWRCLKLFCLLCMFVAGPLKSHRRERRSAATEGSELLKSASILCFKSFPTCSSYSIHSLQIRWIRFVSKHIQSRPDLCLSLSPTPAATSVCQILPSEKRSRWWLVVKESRANSWAVLENSFYIRTCEIKVLAVWLTKSIICLTGTGPKQNILLFVCKFIASTICLRPCCPPCFIYSYHQMITHSLCEHLFDVIMMWFHRNYGFMRLNVWCVCAVQKGCNAKANQVHAMTWCLVDMSLTCSCSDDQAVLCPLVPPCMLAEEEWCVPSAWRTFTGAKVDSPWFSSGKSTVAVRSHLNLQDNNFPSNSDESSRLKTWIGRARALCIAKRWIWLHDVIVNQIFQSLKAKQK